MTIQLDFHPIAQWCSPWTFYLILALLWTVCYWTGWIVGVLSEGK